MAFSVIDRFTQQTLAAVYPISFRTVAVNDGQHVNVCVADELHERLTALLSANPEWPVRWLVCDTQARTCRICEVPEAHELLGGNPPRPDLP